MLHQRVKVTRDTNTVHNKTVAPWEIPVLEFLFEDGNVVRLDEFVEVDEPYPDAPSEFTRLTLLYDKDRKSGVPFVASVYGDGPRGVKALSERIAEAQKDEKRRLKAKSKISKAVTGERPVGRTRTRTVSDAALLS